LASLPPPRRRWIERLDLESTSKKEALRHGWPPASETEHAFGLDLIVAGEEVISCRRTQRPPGILWEHLDPAKVAAIPAQAPGRATGTP
jgi:hypothetical protein